MTSTRLTITAGIPVRKQFNFILFVHPNYFNMSSTIQTTVTPFTINTFYYFWSNLRYFFNFSDPFHHDNINKPIPKLKMNISIGVNKTFLRNLLLEHILDILGRFIQLQVPKVKFNSIPNQSRSINVPNVSVKATWQSNFVSTERGT